MIKEVKNYKRKEIFYHYNSCDNPFVIVTTKIDVTNIVNYCQKHKYFYATMGYLVTKTADEIENFKYRYQDNKFYYCDEIISSYTEMFDDGNIGYFNLDIISNYNDYINNFITTREKFRKENKYVTKSKLNEIWLSCSPWFTFSSLIPPFNKKVTIPQFIWDKFELINDNYYIDLMIMAHHGFVDGSHIGKFIELLNKNIKDFNGQDL